MDDPKGSRREFRPVKSREQVFWAILAVLSIAGMSGTLVMYGMILLIIPGFILMLAPNILLYGGLVRWTVGVWRQRRTVGSVSLAASVVLVVLLGPPMLVNLRQSLHERGLRAGDFDRVPQDLVAPRAIQLATSDNSSCGETCRALLAKGLAESVVLPLDDKAPSDLKRGARAMAVYRIADPATCAEAGSKAAEGVDGCILRRVALEPKVDSLIRVTSRDDEGRDRFGQWNRLNPFALGRGSSSTLSFWTCDRLDHCQVAARQTAISHERMITPLLLYNDLSDYGLEINRAWARFKHEEGKSDPITFLTSRWPAVARPEETQVARFEVVNDLTALTALSNPLMDPDGVKAVFETISEGKGPLEPLQRQLLRTLYNGEYELKTSVDWDGRPEAASAIIDLLGPALLRFKGTSTGSLWSVQHAIATLPDADHARLKPALEAWLKGPGRLPWGRNDPAFLIRLFELGPMIVAPLTGEMLPREGVLDTELEGDETLASLAALCLLGDKAASAAPTLRTRAAYLKMKNWEYEEARALKATLSRIDDGAPKDACLPTLSDIKSLPRGWIDRLAL